MFEPLDTFRTEAEEHLQSLESALLELEINPDDSASIDQALRAMRTIKGAGGMFGFQDLSDFSHHIESAFDKIRNGLFAVSPNFVRVMQDVRDHLEELLKQSKPVNEQKPLSRSLLQRLYAVMPDEQQQVDLHEITESTAKQSAKPDTASNHTSIYRIRFTPSAETFTEGFDVLPLIRELHALGECHVTTQIESLPELQALDPQACYLRWDITLESAEAQETIEDIFIFVASDWHINIDAANPGCGNRIG